MIYFKVLIDVNSRQYGINSDLGTDLKRILLYKIIFNK